MLITCQVNARGALPVPDQSSSKEITSAVNISTLLEKIIANGIITTASSILIRPILAQYNTNESSIQSENAFSNQ